MDSSNGQNISQVQFSADCLFGIVLGKTQKFGSCPILQYLSSKLERTTIVHKLGQIETKQAHFELGKLKENQNLRSSSSTQP